MSVFRNLVGKRINGFYINDERDTFSFRVTDGSRLWYVTQNDCCNTVWVNHVSGIDIISGDTSFDLLRGALVTDTEAKGWTPDRDDVKGHEYVSDGFWTIATDRGYIDIEVRNSHNGYYGGRIEEVEIENLGELDKKVKRIMEDF